MGWVHFFFFFFFGTIFYLFFGGMGGGTNERPGTDHVTLGPDGAYKQTHRYGDSMTELAQCGQFSEREYVVPKLWHIFHFNDIHPLKKKIWHINSNVFKLIYHNSLFLFTKAEKNVIHLLTPCTKPPPSIWNCVLKQNNCCWQRSTIKVCNMPSMYIGEKAKFLFCLLTKCSIDIFLL